MNIPVILHPPNKVLLTTGIGSAQSPLNAFDNALVSAGIGNVSLMRVTSILPSNVKFIKKADFPIGASVPAIYASYISRPNDNVISAAIGYSHTRDGPTLVAEAAGAEDLEILKVRVNNNLVEMRKVRNCIERKDPVVVGVETPVTAVSCVVAAIVYIE